MESQDGHALPALMCPSDKEFPNPNRHHPVDTTTLLTYLFVAVVVASVGVRASSAPL